MKKFTEPIIKGREHNNILPAGYSLVLEGGGMRGFFSAGVLDAFLEADIMFPYIISVSAGSANVLSYVSGQYGRNRVIAEKYVNKRQYSSFKNLITKKSFFDFEYIFKEIAGKHLYFDKEVFNATKIRLLTGVTDCHTGEVIWFEKEELGDDFMPTIASCSIPVLSKVVCHNEGEYLDGGLVAPIGIDKSISDNNHFHVVVLTRNKGYRKKPFKRKRLLSVFLKKYPHLIDSILNRAKAYNQQLTKVEELEQEGKAMIIRPTKPLEVERFNKDNEKVLDLYEEGLVEGRKAVKLLNQRIKDEKREV